LDGQHDLGFGECSIIRFRLRDRLEIVRLTSACQSYEANCAPLVELMNLMTE
jgi:hypothetical protein